MRTNAAILVQTGQPLEIGEIEIPALKPGQVIVQIAYSGVCHTQLLETRGHRGVDAFLPHCLGHEGSGVVLEIGPQVSKVKVGDHVILSWIKGSGMDVPGTVYNWNGRQVNAGAITTFNEHAVTSENRLTVIPKEFPMKEAALLGCAIPTGLGVVFNTAAPRPGQSIAIFGCGGIGLCAIAGASISGCHPIIAIDIDSNKLEAAKKMGATHCINANEQNPVEAIQVICNRSLDFAIEASGRSTVMKQALESVRAQGGTAVVIGNAHHGSELSINPKEFNMGKRLLGTWGGDNIPDVHFPRYCKLMQAGHIDASQLLSKVYSLQEINEALNDLESGKTLRPIVECHAHRN